MRRSLRKYLRACSVEFLKNSKSNDLCLQLCVFDFVCFNVKSNIR